MHGIVAFDGRGGEWAAQVLLMGRREVRVDRRFRRRLARELPLAVTLAVGMPGLPTNMDALVEKACELGVAAIQPLVCVALGAARPAGNARTRRWRTGRRWRWRPASRAGTRVPKIAPVRGLGEWLAALPAAGEERLVLSLRDAAAASEQCARRARSAAPKAAAEAEEDAARRAGFTPLSLGPARCARGYRTARWLDSAQRG